MLIVWKGRGFLIGILTFGWLLFFDWATSALWGENYYARNGWPKLAGFWAAAATVFLLRHRFGVPPSISDINYAQVERPLPATSVHEGEFFFVRARYWPAVLGLLGVAFFFVRE